MGKELKVSMDFYLTMKNGETKEQAEQRFYKIMDALENSQEEHESAYQVYITETQDF